MMKAVKRPPLAAFGAAAPTLFAAAIGLVLLAAGPLLGACPGLVAPGTGTAPLPAAAEDVPFEVELGDCCNIWCGAYV